MKCHTLFLVASTCASAVLPSVAAGTFRNLGFETASMTLPPRVPGQTEYHVPIAQALPGWKGFLGTDAVQYVWLNDLTLGSANIEVIDRASFLTSLVIEGNYTVNLDPGARGFDERVSASISQFGMIPANAESLQLKASPYTFSVSFAGEELSLFPLETGPNYTLYGADIARFAGQSGDLSISAFRNAIQVDSIVFSPYQVPEPSLLGLLGAGILLLGPRLWKHITGSRLKGSET